MLLAAPLLSGCGTQAIVVSEAAITDDPEKRVVGWTADEAPRLVFSPEDEEVTLRALFEFNYRGVYEWYKVEWIAPDGSPYKVVSLRTDFGSHRDIKASLKVRGKMASRLPGVWRARLWLLGREGAPDRLLVSRLFRIAEPTEAEKLAGLTPVDAPGEDAPRPLAQPAPGRVAAPSEVTSMAPPVAVKKAGSPASASPRAADAPGGGAPPAGVVGQELPVPASGIEPGFPLLPPLAIALPENSGAAPVLPSRVPGPGTEPGFPLLPPLAIALPESSGAAPVLPSRVPDPGTEPDFPLLPPLAVALPENSAGTPALPSPVPGPGTGPEFSLLPPLAVVLPESSGVDTATPAPLPGPGTASPAGVESGAATGPVRTNPTGTDQMTPSSGVRPGSPPAARAPAPLTVLSGGSRLSPPVSPAAVVSPVAPASTVRSYDGCPPMYYPPGPDCIERAPQE